MQKRDIFSSTVVVVEDSTTQAMQIRSLLERQGLNVIVATSGPDGLRVVQHVQPAAVVMDLEMPGMNGLQVCRHLKESEDTKHIPIIILTRHDALEAVILGLEVGAVEYIPKDAFANAVLIETLHQMGVIQEVKS